MDDQADTQQSRSSRTVPGCIPQLTEVWNPGDDWTGITDPAERKKRQNRLNQRIWRQLRKQKVQLPRRPPPPQLVAAVIPRSTTADQEPPEAPEGIDSIVDDGTVRQQGHLIHVCPRRRAKTYHLTREAYEDYRMSTPNPSCLSVLIRLNVVHAIAQNAATLGFPLEKLCHDDLISPFNALGPRHPKVSGLPASCPESLQPTPMQVALRHHPWIDLFPIPVMRDNVLHAVVSGIFDEDELCCDLLDVDDIPDTPSEKASLIVWGESWDIRGWEASVPFLKKWGLLLRGCTEILESTNYWRSRRGEKRLDLTFLE
ncbi:hypothetical protein F4819DRAFT_169738 [Hypoxylon fuscum]|nr:hypothetical protein F4819DRAFT_169738 [Hypoxylon fuscum]